MCAVRSPDRLPAPNGGKGGGTVRTGKDLEQKMGVFSWFRGRAAGTAEEADPGAGPAEGGRTATTAGESEGVPPEPGPALAATAPIKNPGERAESTASAEPDEDGDPDAGAAAAPDTAESAVPAPETAGDRAGTTHDTGTPRRAEVPAGGTAPN